MPEADPAGRQSLSPGEFGTAFKAFLEQLAGQHRLGRRRLRGRLGEPGVHP